MAKRFGRSTYNGNVLPLGTIISGTTKLDDVIPALIGECARLRLSREARNLVRRIASVIATAEHATDEGEAIGEAAYYDSENADTDRAYLIDVLSSYTPAFCYVGTHEGDGADLGVWFDHEGFAQAQRDHEVLTIDAGDERPSVRSVLADGYEYLAEITDHGNVTIYRPAGHRWIESVAVV